MQHYLNDNDDFDDEVDVDPTEGPFVLVFFDDDGFENGTLGPFLDEDDAIDASMAAFEYANEHDLKWHPTEIIPESVYYGWS